MFTSFFNCSDTDVKGGKSDKDGRRRGGDAWDKKGRSSDAEEEKFNFDVVQLNSIRISRFKMEKWCHAPFFNDAVIGVSFARAVFVTFLTLNFPLRPSSVWASATLALLRSTLSAKYRTSS